jgi:polyisoprenoid-binding protein YceI
MRQLLCALGISLSVALIGCGGPQTATPPGGGPTPQVKPTNISNHPSTALDSSKAEHPKGGASGAITPENTKIDFIGTKPEGKHDGGFKKFTGNLKLVDGDITKSTLTVDIDTDSLWADDPKLTTHLKSPDFFDVKKFPDAKFVSKEIKAEKKDDNTHVITGDLTLHGTTKSLTFPAKVTTTDDAVTVESTFKFDRTDFGIAFAPDKVNKEVTVKVNAKVARK